jgi:hypothetical protein
VLSVSSKHVKFTFTLARPERLWGPPSTFESHLAKREIFHILWDLKIHYYLCKTLPLIPTLSQMNPHPASLRCILILSSQPPIQWVPGALSLGVKWPEREADYLPPSIDEVKNA